ncbi:endosome-associated-trafficking regulator 1-like [Oxyura jamaicensis]|uniref:endosome-associated-trafficking regulator 1-like n=1 Tax=Oxyura jamaicensis TaxID=8884 RepID=UPI0015A663BA|nr:endosome-associated-trafficking regulator 1-like [Oxyura jamaicensis]
MSRPLGISGAMERACPEPQDLEDDDDDDDDEDNDDYRYAFHSMHPPPQCKSRDSSGDSQLEDPGGPVPVPFPLKPRHSCVVKEGEKNRMYAKRLARHVLELEEDARDFQEPFYKETEASGSLSEEEDDSWSRTYHLPMHRRPHVPHAASSSPRSPYDSFQHGTSKHLGTEAFALWAHASDPHLTYPEHGRAAEPHMQQEEAVGDRELPSLQLTYKVLRDENNVLRRMVRSMQSSLESQARTVRSLERRLKASLVKEEREAQGLQTLVQQAERSLQLMTQRALEAESNVEKLKQEMIVLQGELETSKVENENLRAGQTTDLGAVKHNIDFALQSLHKIISGANLSIRQLVSGAESLNFVAELLKSTGKISDVEEEKDL